MKANLEALLDKVGWSKAKAARVLEVHRNTVSDWCKIGEAPAAVVRLLELLIRHQELLREFTEGEANGEGESDRPGDGAGAERPAGDQPPATN